MPDSNLLLLPGTLCTGAVFSRQVEALSGQCANIQIATFSKERSIETMAETAASLIPEGSQVAVAGFSMGGMVALALAERYPEKVERIALLNSNCHPDLPERRNRRGSYVEEARQKSLRVIIKDGFLQNYLHRQSPPHRELILDMAEEHGLAGFEAQSEALAGRPDLGPALSQLTCPVLILGARQDVLCPPQVQWNMHEECAHAHLVMLEDCGHFAVLEKPAEVSKALLNWLAETANRPNRTG